MVFFAISFLAVVPAEASWALFLPMLLSIGGSVSMGLYVGRFLSRESQGWVGREGTMVVGRVH